MSSLRHLRNVLLTPLYPSDMESTEPLWHPFTLNDSKISALVSSGLLYADYALSAVPTESPLPSRKASCTGMITLRYLRSGSVS